MEWDESLTTQMLVFGVLLIACFVAPWAVGAGKTVFSWSILSVNGAPFVAKMVPLLLAVTGISSIALGALKLGSSVRAMAAAGIGLSPIVFQMATADPIGWQTIVGALSGILLITGLVVRSRRTTAIHGRILATVGVVGMLALYLVPENDTMLVKMLLDMLADIPGKGKLIPILGQGVGGLVVGLLPLLLTLLCLLVWLPSDGRAGTHILVWMVIFAPLLASLGALAISEDILPALKSSLASVFYLPLAGAAWMTLAGFGLGGVISEKIQA